MARKKGASYELIALSSAAVLGVYAAGYILTQPAADLANQPAHATASARPTGYHDGIYTAVGTDRFGDVTVAVSIQNGKIAALWITSVTTRFPVDLIAGLPGQVVARQSGAVDVVSGATGSTAAFVAAVKRALQQASE